MRTASTEVEAVLLGAAGALFLGCFCLGGVRLCELAAEAVYATCGVDQLLLAGEEGVAGGADFEDDVALVGGARLEDGSAGALYVDVFILRVNPLLRHDSYPFGRLRACGSLANGAVHRHIEVPVALPAGHLRAVALDADLTFLILPLIRTAGNWIQGRP